MRVLAMVHAYLPDHNAGAELTIHALLRHLAARGHHVEVLLSRPGRGSADYVYEDVNVTVFRGDGYALSYFQDSPPDVVISHLENTTRACVLAGMYGAAMVHLLHNTTDFSRHCLRRGPADLAVFNAQWMAQDYAAWWAGVGLGELPNHVVIAPPVFAADLVPADRPGGFITQVNLFADKGGEQFWELAAALPQRKFLGVKGAYGEQVIPKDLRAYPNVTVMGHVAPSAMRAVYLNTRVLLMPSVYESYGRTAIEAACMGIPTIAHPTPGLVESLGDSGVFVHRDDIDGWIKALRRLGTPRAWALESRRARARAAQLSPQADLDRFADVLEGVRGLVRTG